MRSTSIIFFLILFSVKVFSQMPAEKELYMRAVKSHRYKAYPEFLTSAIELDHMRPNKVRYVYDLACAYALNARPKEAVKVLKRAVLMDNSLDIDNDPDLATVRSLPEFSAVQALREKLSKVVKTSVPAVTLNEKDLHPEGLCYLKKHKTWLATSIRHGKIVSFDKKGKCSDWIDLKYSVFAIKPDADEEYLWAATAGVPQQQGYLRSLERTSQVVKIEIANRKVVDSISVPGSHVFGDLIVSRSGTVYVSDSESPMIMKISGKVFSPWLFLTGGNYNLQGLAFNADESAIYLSDYARGILRVSAADPNDREWMEMPADTTPRGIDGLVFFQNSLIAVHNGVNPIRIIRYFLDSSGKKITSYKVLDNNRLEFDEPALGVIRDGDFYFFANAPWNAYDRRMENLDDTKYGNPVLMRCPLN